MLIAREKSTRWYRVTESGSVECCYEIPKKDGKGMKAPNINDAKELGLLPSVTSILSILAKPALEAWKMEKAIVSALTLPRLEGESIDDFAKRVVKDSGEEAGEAASFGTAIHDAIDAWLVNKTPPPPDLAPYMSSVMEWMEGNVSEVIFAEKAIHHTSMGYAGRMDCFCALKRLGTGVLDYKTQNVKRNKKGEKVPVFYPEWSLQLASYAACNEIVEPSWPSLISIVIDSSEPGPVHVKEWRPQEDYWELFLHCLKLWRFTKGYNI